MTAAKQLPFKQPNRPFAFQRTALQILSRPCRLFLLLSIWNLRPGAFRDSLSNRKQMNTQLVTKLIQKRLTLPTQSGPKGDSRSLARQLDSVLMDNGFKLSSALLKHLGTLSFENALSASNVLLSAVKELVGAHVKHNTFFKDFPKNVPNTLEFWGGLLAKYYEETGEFTNNLLDFPTYGKYQHTYEEMLERHDKWRGKVTLKVINLGFSETEELQNLYADLAGSKIPLNEDDRKLIEELYKAGLEVSPIDIPVRENKAIINALRIGKRPLLVDTPVDILRLATHLSGGDVTLLENTKFKSFPRSVRRELVYALHSVSDKIEDTNRYREQFKRLGKFLHAREYGLKAVNDLFDFVHGQSDIKTWGSKVHEAIAKGRVTKAVNLLTEKPGYLVRSLDKLTRDATDAQFTNVLNGFKETVQKVSGRVLLGLAEHLDNRSTKSPSRIFVNRAGRGYAVQNMLDTLPEKRIKSLSRIVWKEIERRVPEINALVVNDDVATVAVPLSEKTKSEGFRVLPRGSVFSLDNTHDILRFFIYWRQTSQRTDYDLSVAMFDKDFNFRGQVSWTNYHYGASNYDGRGAITHSGDITDATNGATEFIDMRLNKVPSDIVYLLPTINAFAGEAFSQCKEAFMGFMTRKDSNKGAPFEAKSVQSKFALRGDKNGVGVPMVFIKTDEGWQAKWLDLYSKGMPWGNRVEQNRFSTALLARTMIQRKYLTMNRLIDVYRKKAKKTYKIDKVPKTDVTYIGLNRPEGLTGTFYTLDNLKSLIPA